MKTRIRLFAVLLAALAVIIPPAAAAETVTLPNDISWVKTSAAYLGCVQQAYLNGINRLQKLAEGKKPGTWCVVLDADETIITNVQFQAEQFANGEGYTNQAWTAWCQRSEARALPGAIDFLNEVRRLGGKIIIITNRQEPLREPTIKNLEKEGIPFDVCLLREGPYREDRTKAQRRSDVEQGTLKNLRLGERQPKLEILMLVGDQPHDLYEKQIFSEVKDRFGNDLIILPNPMYGDGIGSTFEVPPGMVRASSPAAAAPAAVTAIEEAPAAEEAPAPRSRAAGAAITWQEAMRREGQTVTVEARIVSVYDPESRGRGGPVKLNTDRDFKTSLTIIFYKKDRSGRDQGFGDLSRFEGKTVRVTGKVSDYQGQKQLTVSNSSQIEVID